MRTLCAQLGVILFALCSVAGLAQDPLESFDTKVKRLFDNPVGIKIDQLNRAAPALTLQEASELAGQDRNQIIAILHEVLRDPHLRGRVAYRYSEVFQILLQLGDERGMQLAGETLRTEPELRESDLRSSQFARDIGRAAQPAVLPYIAPLLFLNETPESDVTVPYDIPTGDKISFQAADIVQRVVEAAEAIPWEVKEWSRQLGRSRFTREEYREILREWWKANEEAFRRKDYAAVRPGLELSETETAAAEPAPPTSPALPEPTWEPPPIAPASPPVPSKEIALPIATTPSGQQSWWGFVAAAAFALVLAGLLFFGSRRA